MDIDFRWGGDPNIVLAVQAAHVASIPIQAGASYKVLFLQSVMHCVDLNVKPSFLSFFQLKDLQVFTVVRAIFQLSDEIPCISAVVVALLAEVHSNHISFF